MRRSSFSTIVVSISVAGLLGLAGCGRSDPPAGSAASASPEVAIEATPSVTSLPDGYQYVTAEKSGLQLAVPGDWRVVDVEEMLSDPAVQATMSDALTSSGYTLDKIKNAGIELMMISPEGDTNVNVIPAGPGRLAGAEDQITSQLATVGASDVTISRTTTPVGEAAVASYTLVVGGTTQHGMQVYQQVDSSITVITVTASSPDRAQEVADTIVSTIGKADS